MEPEGPSAPTSEDRSVETVIRLAQLCPALDRPKRTPGRPEETGGPWTGRSTTRTGALARTKETRRLQPRQKSPRFQLHNGASKSSRPSRPSRSVATYRSGRTISSNFKLEEQTWNVIENKGPAKWEPGMFMKTREIVR